MPTHKMIDEGTPCALYDPNVKHDLPACFDDNARNTIYLRCVVQEPENKKFTPISFRFGDNW